MKTKTGARAGNAWPTATLHLPIKYRPFHGFGCHNLILIPVQGDWYYYAHFTGREAGFELSCLNPDSIT